MGRERLSTRCRRSHFESAAPCPRACLPHAGLGWQGWGALVEKLLLSLGALFFFGLQEHRA